MKATILSLAVVVACVCGGCKKDDNAAPTSPGLQTTTPTGKIAYVWRSGYSARIHVMDANGSNNVDLVDGNGPKWSPNGQKIAFSPPGELWVMNADGSDQRRLLRNVGYSYMGNIWAPSSDKLIVSGGGYPNDTVYIVNADGSGSISVAPGTIAQWSPSGDKISFFRYGNGLFIANPDGSSQQMIANLEPTSYVWSGTGDKIAVLVSPGIAIITISTLSTITIPAPSGFDVGELNWSRDGAKIAFSGYGPLPSRSINSQLFSMNPDGSSITRITNDTLGNFDPRFSPDGGWLVFHKFPSGATHVSATHVMKIDGSNIIKLTDGPDDVEAEWKPQ
jgi:Tol biopolymer transport system component